MASVFSQTSLPSRQVLADRVYEELLAALIDGRFEADASLSIDGIARDLGVSPTPVREALARLEHTGMVRRAALKGYRVAPLMTAEEHGQLVAVRKLIEAENAELACARADGEMVEQLADTIERLRTAPTGGSYSEFRDYWKADEDFHRLIAEFTGNPFLLTAFQALGGQVQRFRLFAGRGVTDADCAISEHTKILLAFQAGDPQAARAAMEKHLEGVGRRAVEDSSE
ncbi:GntR family transcriptional regulator [Arthrobacter sp. MYb229]|uniref:GntR family transcriptional regulator n=1 Tax=unclassified Arthrobacter TaxID=235627 RepID=UPI000CFB316A|nr:MULTISPECIES: GntR family transcriptional regulator [unclassified Arthrobacter]PRA04446.1 GntR family transcriptional regulator [Arthrobacter sp. MYb229]PRB51641.1 GntR family transcriptional regulator [Arthrobacter sp. MYb216]